MNGGRKKYLQVRQDRPQILPSTAQHDVQLVAQHPHQFVSIYEPKYPKATASLLRDRAALLAFYDFPAEH